MLPSLVPTFLLALAFAVPGVAPIPAYGLPSRAVYPPYKQCTLPGAGEDFESATPGEVNLNQTAVDEAIAYASTHGRISVQIFRHNCRVARGPLDLLTDERVSVEPA